jgi:hypothetical protein
VFTLCTARVTTQKFYVLHSECVYVLFICISKKQGVLVCTELSDWSLNRTSFFRVCVTNWSLPTLSYLSNLDLKNSNTIRARQIRPVARGRPGVMMTVGLMTGVYDLQWTAGLDTKAHGPTDCQWEWPRLGSGHAELLRSHRQIISLSDQSENTRCVMRVRLSLLGYFQWNTRSFYFVI